MSRSPFGAAKLESLDPPPKPDPNPLPNAFPAIALKPLLLDEAKDDSPLRAKGLVDGPSTLEPEPCPADDTSVPKGDADFPNAEVVVGSTAAVEDVPAITKGETVAPARAANPEDAKADADVSFGSVVAGFVEGGFVRIWAAFDARSPNGEVVELLAKPLVARD